MKSYSKIIISAALCLLTSVIFTGCSSSKTEAAGSEDNAAAIAGGGSEKTGDATATNTKNTKKTAKKKDDASLLSQFDKSELNSAKRREKYNDMSKQMDMSDDKVMPWKSDSENRSEQLRENKKSGSSMFYNW